MSPIAALVACLVIQAPASPGRSPEEIVFREGLAIPSPGRFERSPLHVDAVEAEIVAGRAIAPKGGDSLALPDGKTLAWESLSARDDGLFERATLGRGGYLHVSVASERERVMVLEATGHGMVYVNGEPRTGDPYRWGFSKLPVLLRPGANAFLFHCSRGPVRAKLVEPPSEAFLNAGDVTLPDAIAGETRALIGSITIVNASHRALTDAQLQIGRLARDGFDLHPVGSIPPLSSRKVAFDVSLTRGLEPGDLELRISVVRRSGATLTVLDSTTVSIRVRRPGETHRRTFRSEIDGSVQFYAVRPALPPTADAPPPALVLTLHGAGVDALGQVEAYSPKSWAHLVAPTNRRPFGFDWEDWGRLDALEVLEHARALYSSDASRTYLTGHSMGGHGTWQLGATFPDRFAAIGPSAGWPSFSTYAGATAADGDSPTDRMLRRAASPSDTLSLLGNTAAHGVYVLHGDADDNVPIAQARLVKEKLETFHRDFTFFEQPGAGHWWDASDEPGSDCVDWAPMFDFFARHAIPPSDSVRDVSFATANPGASASCRWAAIEAQIHPLERSSVTLRCDPLARRFRGTTENVARLALSLRALSAGAPVSLEIDIDGTKLEGVAWPSGEPRLVLRRARDAWTVGAAAPLSEKGPHRSGPFKDAFRHRVQFVYGTRGTAEENAWALAKARYDAETFGYRGNASVDVIADVEFDASREPDRSVIVYGNSETNGAWRALLGSSPVQVRRGSIRIGEREEKGDDLACLFVRPRPGSDVASVGVIAGSGPRGMRLTDRLPIFTSGIAWPDCTIVGPEALAKGSAGVRAAGFFGNDWSVETGEFAWRP